MIKKNYEIKELNLNFNYFLFYGKNEGLKNETIIKIFRDISYFTT